MTDKEAEFVEVIIWISSVSFGFFVAVKRWLVSTDNFLPRILKALGLGLLGTIAFMGVALFIYLAIDSKLTLKEDGE